MLGLIGLRRRRLSPIAARLLNPTQRAAQRFDFPFVGGFLAFRQLDELAHFFHLFQNLFERFDNLPHFVNGPADGGRILSGAGSRWNFQFGRG